MFNSNKKNNIKFLTLLTASFFTLTFIVSVGLSFFYYINLGEILTDYSHQHLEIVSKLRADHIKMFLEWGKGRTVDFASDGFIKRSLIKLKKNSVGSNSIIEELNNHLVANKLPTGEDIYEVVVIDWLGRVVSTTDPNKLIDDKFNKLIFQKGKNNPFIKEVFYDKELGRKAIAFSAPILDKKEFLGIVVIKISPKSLADIMTDKIGLEKSELYLINQDGYLLTPSKFLKGENKGVLTQVVDTENSRDCLKDVKNFFEDKTGKIEYHEEGAGIFRDYRGEYVFGAHAYIEGMRWCLLAEISKKDAVEKYRNEFVKKHIVITGFMAVAFAIIGFFVARFL